MGEEAGPIGENGQGGACWRLRRSGCIPVYECIWGSPFAENYNEDSAESCHLTPSLRFDCRLGSRCQSPTHEQRGQKYDEKNYGNHDGDFDSRNTWPSVNRE
jgi:hypothetical protein